MREDSRRPLEVDAAQLAHKGRDLRLAAAVAPIDEIKHVRLPRLLKMRSQLQRHLGCIFLGVYGKGGLRVA